MELLPLFIRRSRSIAAALATVMFGFAAGAAQALECPIAHPQAGKGVLQETRPDIEAASKALSAHAAGAAPGIIAGLKLRHPTASNGEIVNYLVTAYCPVVNRQPGRSEAAKRAQMARFNRSIVKTIYR